MKKRLLFLISLCITACFYNSTEPLSNNSIIGEWQWIKSVGSIAGGIYTPQSEGYTQTLVFKENGHVLHYRDSILITNSAYSYSGDTLYIDTNGFAQFISIKDDKMVISDACADCFVSDYQRVQRVIQTETALLTWNGPYEVDGCGFIFTINGKEYKAENEESIDDSFKQADSIYVEIDFSILDRKINMGCWDNPFSLGYDGIRVHAIRTLAGNENTLGFISGYDYRKCVCCGGLFINIDTETYRFYDIPANSGFNYSDTLVFPIPVMVQWKPAQNQCLGDEIEIKSLTVIPWQFAEIKMAPNFTTGEYESDPLNIDDADVAGDILILKVASGGGCTVHSYDLYASSAFFESYPVQAGLVVVHEDNDDPCDAIVRQFLYFDLKPLKQSYFESYMGTEGSMFLRISVGEDSSVYEPLPYYSF
jgi:hypothetical protein